MWRTATIIIAIALVLITLGIVMLASTSGFQAQTQYGDAYYFVKRQALWLAIGLLAAFVTARLDYHVWRPLAVPMAVVLVFLLLLVLLPGIGVNVKGSSRWLRLGPLTFQPSELAKFVSVNLLAWWMAHVRRRAGEFTYGLLIPIICLGAILLLIFVEPDFGTTMLVGAVGMALMFVGGSHVAYLALAAVAGLVVFSLAIMEDAERMRRIIAFINPEKYAQDEAFQLLNAIYAFVVGGGAGVGFGMSLQKRFYLPEAHTDFIFAILGEELGLAASLGVVLLFVALLILGMRVSFRAPDKYGKLLAFGITLMITLQAAINIGVVTGCLPTKGLPLPFISFGGTSMLVTLAMTGVLVNISTHSISAGEADLRAIKDSAHRF